VYDFNIIALERVISGEDEVRPHEKSGRSDATSSFDGDDSRRNTLNRTSDIIRERGECARGKIHAPIIGTAAVDGTARSARLGAAFGTLRGYRQRWRPD
jgi:hypothetical protein